jgi:hypothetical protein
MTMKVCMQCDQALRRGGRLLLGAALLVTLVSCGGEIGVTDDGIAKEQDTSAQMAQSSLLSRQELEQARKNEDQALEGASEGFRRQVTGVSKFSLGTRVAVYRFYVPSKGAHFYTANVQEAQWVRTNRSDMLEEGIAFYVSSTPAPGLFPVFRYYNAATGTHFYTISAAEKSFVDANIRELRYEGVAYYSSQTGGAGLIALTRFYRRQPGSHFYTQSSDETADVRNRLASLYQEEGIAYYVIDPGYVAPESLILPHTGITTGQCYEAGSDALVSCTSTAALALHSEQDGHRTDVNPMGYREVPRSNGGFYARTECVQDNVTGLIWEGKEAAGLRAGSNTYTHYDNPNLPQKYDPNTWGYVNPTQVDIESPSNSIGYLNYVNSIALCGFTDWRLPEVEELEGLVDASISNWGYDCSVPIAPKINTTWFPNTSGTACGSGYWSSMVLFGESEMAWKVDYVSGEVDYTGRSSPLPVRLVRSALNR